MKTRKVKQGRGKRKIRGGACPAGMPPRVCETWKKKHERPHLPHELQRNIKQMAHYLNFKRKPLNERTKLLKKAWNNYIESRQSISSGQSNNLNNENLNNVHDFSENEI